MTDVMSLVPAPEGYVVDFDNPQRLADKATYWCFGIGTLMSVLFTGQRIYVKSVVRTPWQLDDVFIVISLLLLVATQGLIIRAFVERLNGVHIWEMSVDALNRYLMNVWIAATIYVPAASCMKLALCIFYLRISPQRWLRTSVFATMTIISGYTIGLFFAFVFGCRPIEKNYNALITEGHCIDAPALYISTAAVNIVSDVMLFILPMPMIFGLQMPLKQKLGLFFMFGIGSATVVTSIVRAVFLPPLLTTTDPTWVIAYPALLIIIEANLIIVCGMLPTLRMFFRRVAPKFIGESARYGRAKSKTPVVGVSSKSSKLVVMGAGGGAGASDGASDLVTFGSLPSAKRHQLRTGYAQFGGSGPDGYPMETIGNSEDDDDDEFPADGGGGDLEEGGGGGGGGDGRGKRSRGVSSQQQQRDDDIDDACGDLGRLGRTEIGTVDTRVVAGRRNSDWGGERGGTWLEGQCPVVTTRIEVKYDRNDKVVVVPGRRRERFGRAVY